MVMKAFDTFIRSCYRSRVTKDLPFGAWLEVNDSSFHYAYQLVSIVSSSSLKLSQISNDFYSSRSIWFKIDTIIMLIYYKSLETLIEIFMKIIDIYLRVMKRLYNFSQDFLWTIIILLQNNNQKFNRKKKSKVSNLEKLNINKNSKFSNLKISTDP